MPVTRRAFVGSGLAGVAGCHAKRPPPAAPLPPPRAETPADALGRALDVAKRAGASFADSRLVRRRNEVVSAREDHVAGVSASETYGIGVRVIVDGAWGFAASAFVSVGAAEETALKAVMIARAGVVRPKHPVELAAAPVVSGAWRTRMEIDPFAVPLADKVEWLLALWPLVKDVPLVKYTNAAIETNDETKTYASSEGSFFEQSQTRIWPSLVITAVDNGQFETRASDYPPMQAGWEYVTRSPLRARARSYAEDAVAKLKSPSVRPGKRDLVLAPSNLWLTIHESVGHPTELDRIVGLEQNFAGTSFCKTDDLGKLRYGSDKVTIYADRIVEGGLASCAWDDDGVATQRWDLVRDGTLVGLQTTRDQAGWIGEKASHGTSYAQDHASVPFQRMPNVSLAAQGNLGIGDLVAATDDGVLVTGTGSWSIDHQRYNFQFSGQTFHEIKNGKITHPLRDVAYQSTSLDFWRSCDMVGGPGTWELHGTLQDGKGEPQQLNAVSHGCPAARFRKVDVINVNARSRT